MLHLAWRWAHRPPICCPGSPANGTACRRLREAAERGDAHGVRTELEAGVAVNDCGATKWTALHRASERGRTEIVQLLLGAGANHLLQTASGGDTPLHLAADRGHASTVQELLRAGADPRAKSKRGWTALHAALYSNRTQVVRDLLRAGADPEDENDQGLTPRDVSLSSPRLVAVSSPRTDYALTPRDLAGLSSPTVTDVSVATLASLPAAPFSPGLRGFGLDYDEEKRRREAEYQQRRAERDQHRRQEDEARKRRDADRAKRRDERRRELNVSLKIGSANGGGGPGSRSPGLLDEMKILSPARVKTAKEQHLETIKMRPLSPVAPPEAGLSVPTGSIAMPSAEDKEERLRQITAGATRSSPAIAEGTPPARSRTLASATAAVEKAGQGVRETAAKAPASTDAIRTATSYTAKPAPQPAPQPEPQPEPQPAPAPQKAPAPQPEPEPQASSAATAAAEQKKKDDAAKAAAAAKADAEKQAAQAKAQQEAAAKQKEEEAKAAAAKAQAERDAAAAQEKAAAEAAAAEKAAAEKAAAEKVTRKPRPCLAATRLLTSPMRPGCCGEGSR